MKIGLVYTLMALASFSALGIFHKIADVKQGRPPAINMLMFCWSLIFVSLSIWMQHASFSAVPLKVVWISVPFGVAGSAAVLALQAGIRHGNIATSWLAINLSASVPTLLSIFLYREAISPAKVVALLLIPISIVLVWRDRQQQDRQASQVSE